MDHCKYHPLDAATYACNSCGEEFCDHCVDESKGTADVHCFLCNSRLQSLGSGNTVEPFWRRLDESFKYPTEKSALTFIIGAALISTVLSLLPSFGLFSLIAYLALSGAIFKYCLVCLLNTAHGDMTPPDFTEAYSGGLRLMLKLFGLMMVLAIGLGALSHYIPALGGLMGAVLVICLPAILIRFAQSERVFDAANPLAALQLILAIGLPYGLMLAFIIIMIGSMGVLNELVGFRFGILSIAIQSVIGNYYLVVIFHLAGYMLFQYQDQLGYTARLADDEQRLRSDADIAFARIQVLLKEGDLSGVVDGFAQGMRKFPQDPRFADLYLEFCYKTKHQQLMSEFADRYLARIVSRVDTHGLDIHYKKIKQICPKFVPRSAKARHQIAIQCHRKGDLKTAASLLNGLHKDHMDYDKLIDAYKLLASCLQGLPGLESKAEGIYKLIDQIALKQSEMAAKQEVAKSPVHRRPPRPKLSLEQTIKDQADEDKGSDLPPLDFK